VDRQDVKPVQIIRGNALALPLADDSVDLVVTSPPYFGLRSYQDGGEHYSGQIGDEPTPAEFVDALIAATAEMARVTKPSGSIWVNLGDKYAASGTMQTKHGLGSSSLSSGVYMEDALAQPFKSRKFDNGSVRHKSLIGIPWRYAIRCIDDLGLILRAEVIWSKPNGLPESVTDRVRRSHEQWFHFTLNPRYYSAVDEIREPSGPEKACGPGAMRGPRSIRERGTADPTMNNPLGKLPGSVWTVATEPLHVPDHLGIDHFAAFPTEWPRRIIQGWSPRGICVECGEGRRPVVDRKPMEFRPSPRNLIRKDEQGTALIGNNAGGTMLSPAETTITGEACACPEPTAPTRPGVVLDPFGGTGTTALVAHALGRHGISNDMSADYCRLAGWRTSDPKQQAKAARRPFVPPAEQTEGQLDLLEGIA
jgi:DNA modification methylase